MKNSLLKQVGIIALGVMISFGATARDWVDSSTKSEMKSKTKEEMKKYEGLDLGDLKEQANSEKNSLINKTKANGPTADSTTYFNDMQEAINKQFATGFSGIPTSDLANITTGLFNVEAVFGVFHQNEVVRDLDTRTCGEMGVSALANGGDSTGKHCCDELWEIEGTALKDSIGIKKTMGGALGGRDERDRNRLRTKEQFIKYCCQLSDDKEKGDKEIFCQTVAQEKKGCTWDQLNNGQNMKAALEVCGVDCDPKVYGTFKHNEDEKYDEDEVEDILKACTAADTEWAPTSTVPGSKEFAPVVPSDISEVFEKGEKKQ